MILQDNRFAVAQVLGDPTTFLAIEDNPAKLRIHGVILVETQGVLRDHVQFAAERAEGFAVYRVGLDDRE